MFYIKLVLTRSINAITSNANYEEGSHYILSSVPLLIQVNTVFEKITQGSFS